jgi:TonB family protein
LLAASGATLYVLATDATLVATIRRAVGDRYPLLVVESWAELRAAAESGRCGIALLDAAVLGHSVKGCVSALAAHADRLVTLVAADRTAAQEYFGLLSDGRLHRLLIKPAAVGAARLLIESATARCLQLREDAVNDGPISVAVAGPKTFSKWPWAIAVGVSAVALLGTAVVGDRLGWWERSGAVDVVVAPATAAAAAVETVPTPAERLSALRASATLALQQGRLAEPVGANALDDYLAILALAPSDQAARDGVSSVLETLFMRAEEALLTDSLETAAAALDHVRRADPASSRLAFLQAQLARGLAALPPRARASAAPLPATAASTELENALNLAAARLRRGQLLSPSGDSARAYLDRAVALDPSDPRVATLRTDLAAALVATARLVSDSDVAAATSLAAEARRLGAEPAALAALERDFDTARVRGQERRLTELLDAARERVQNGSLFAPLNDSALDYLSRLQADAPELAGLAEAWEAFRQASVVAIQRAIETGEWALADAQLAGFTPTPGGAVAAAPLAAELAARRLQQTYLAAAAPASELDLRSSVPVVYPSQAIARGIEGWVDLEFVVDRTGQPRNLAVVQASPPGRFDAAALAAVAQYRYVPFERDSRVYERLLRLRVRFQM